MWPDSFTWHTWESFLLNADKGSYFEPETQEHVYEGSLLIPAFGQFPSIQSLIICRIFFSFHRNYYGSQDRSPEES